MSRTPSDTKQVQTKEAGGSFLADVRGTAAADGAAPAKSSRRFSSSYLMAAAMLAISAGALFGMRAYGKKSGLGDSKSMAEIQTVKTDSATMAKTQRVLAELEAHGTPLQIPADAIRRNPFELGISKPVAVPTDTKNQNRDAEARAKEAAEREARERDLALAEKLKSLEVTAVIMGSRPVARISGKLYRVGDTVIKTFSILEITERGAKLGFEGKEYDLVIKQALNADGSKPEDEADAHANKRPRNR